MNSEKERIKEINKQTLDAYSNEIQVLRDTVKKLQAERISILDECLKYKSLTTELFTLWSGYIVSLGAGPTERKRHSEIKTILDGIK